jgi:hypothetical protein
MGTKEFIADVHTPKQEEDVSDLCRKCVHFGVEGPKCRGLSKDGVVDICSEYDDKAWVGEDPPPLPHFIFVPKKEAK